MKCPHCNKNAQIRTSEYLSPIVQKHYYRCTNPKCLHQFTALLSITATTLPSKKPNPEIKLPFSIRWIRQMKGH